MIDRNLLAEAKAGDPEAQFNLGNAYVQGQGVRKDYVQAAVWYRMAAKQGYAEAQYRLGLAYGQGMGVPKDFKQAAAWYSKADEQVDEEEFELKAGWYLRGARLGDAFAQF